jgi:GNAT superfamily N-acetyltransferase
MARLDPTGNSAEVTGIPALRAMQERSMRVLGRHYYTATQIEAFIARIGTMDDYLVHDRTYLLAAIEREIVGSGGWNTRLPGYARHIKDEQQPHDPARTTIRSVFVEPLVARHGVGRSIMDAVENAMRAEGFRTAELAPPTAASPSIGACPTTRSRGRKSWSATASGSA